VNAELNIRTKNDLCYHAQGNSGSSYPPIVFLHGWAIDSGVWKPLVALFKDTFTLILLDLPGFGINATIDIEHLQDVLTAIERVLPEKCHLVGWSLGGMLAAQLVDRNPQRFFSLMSIASNAKFSADESWPDACDAETYRNFYAGFKKNPDVTIRKFLQLQAKGDNKSKACLKFVRGEVQSYCCENYLPWLRALEWLDSIDNRVALEQSSIPHLAIFGENDSLVPSPGAHNFVQFNLSDRSHVVKGAGHVPHVTAVAEVAEIMVQHIKRTTFMRDKQRVATSFSHAAKNYDRVATLQRKVAYKLTALQNSYAGKVCDIGCGTGFCGDGITDPRCDLFGLDIAYGMLARSRQKKAYSNGKLVCADFENLPYRRNSFDGVVSSMSLQWSENLQAVFRGLKSILVENGWFLFTTLGPHTLHELHNAWRSVDHYVHVNRFELPDKIRFALQSAGFRILSESNEREVLEYDTVIDLMRDLKSIGAHNVNRGIKSGLTTRRQLRQVETAYGDYRRNGKLPATYDVYYFFAQTP